MRARHPKKNMPQLKVELQQRQVDAINNWKRANCRGILAMATGTGKTIAALGAAASLENNEDASIIVEVER